MRRKIGVPALGGHHVVAPVMPEQNGLAKAGACGDQGSRSARLRCADVQYQKILGRQMLQAVSPSAEVVDEGDVFDFQFALEVGGFHNPGEIGGANGVVDHRSSDTEAGSLDALALQMRCGSSGELFDNQLKSREVLAGEALLKNRGELAAFF